MVHPSQQRSSYPSPQPPLSVTVTRRGRTHAFTMRPWVVGSALCALAVLAISVLGGAGYLIFRDDLIGAALSRQVEMQYAYEERIAALRSELDRVTSRHSVQSEGVEQRLATLLDKQALIEGRQSALDALVDKARASGVQAVAAETRLPRPRPDKVVQNPQLDSGSVAPLSYMPTRPAADQAITDTLLHGGASGGPHPALHDVLSYIQSSLDAAQAQQSQALDTLVTSVEDETERLSAALAPIGIEVEDSEVENVEPQGGPYVPAIGMHFVERTAVLNRMLDDIHSLRRSAAALPLRAPVTAQRISSRFGYRMDPFLKRRGFHAGLDMVAPRGTTVRAPAPGVVVTAGREGGYGNLVEIRHVDGISTRYGHLSAMLVTRGDKVSAGTPIGQVGSTGRSTGPHLHYETRRDGEAVNPAVFLAAGRALGGP